MHCNFWRWAKEVREREAAAKDLRERKCGNALFEMSAFQVADLHAQAIE